MEDPDEFDPESEEAREVGSDMVDDSSGLGSVVAHMYRGEMERVVVWRERLDSTTNWAVTIIGAILAYAFSSSDVAHSIILVAMLIGVVFLVIEARRFQRYDVWRSRVRSMQENLFADALDPSQGVEQTDWRAQLSRDYRQPETRLLFRDALGHRLKRVYLPILAGLLLIWLFRLGSTDEPVLEAAAIENTPGWIVLGAVAAGYACLFAVAFWPGNATPSETDETTDRGDLARDG